MKNFVFCLFLGLCLISGGQAGAFETPLTDAPSKALLQKTASSLKTYAERFGCEEFVWGNVTGGGTVVTVQFLPKDMPDQTQWQRMVSISLYGMTGDKKADGEVVDRMVQGLESQAAKLGEVVVDKLYLSRTGNKTMFLEYTKNKGKPERIDIAGVFMPVSDRSYALIQLNARIIPIKPEEELSMHRLVNPRAL